MTDEKLNIEEFIMIGDGNRHFEKHRRALLHNASTEQLLAFKLELIETLGLLELHSRADNSVTAWYVRKLSGLLSMVDDLTLRHRRKRNGWD